MSDSYYPPQPPPPPAGSGVSTSMIVTLVILGVSVIFGLPVLGIVIWFWKDITAFFGL